MRFALRTTVSILQFCVVMYTAQSFAQENIFPKIVGKWREWNSAITIIVEKDGAVFSPTGSVFSGTVERSIEGGGNFAFENANTRCVYDITVLGPPLQGATSWGLRSERVPNSCPKTGIFFPVSKDAPPATAMSLSVSEKDVVEAKSSASEPYHGPPELAGINVVYFDRAEDGGKVAKALRLENVPFSTRPSDKTSPSNVVTCTPDVPLSATKKLASMLISNGIVLRAISPSVWPHNPKRLTVEFYDGYNDYRSLTLSDIAGITECKLQHDPIYGFSVIHDCAQVRTEEGSDETVLYRPILLPSLF